MKNLIYKYLVLCRTYFLVTYLQCGATGSAAEAQLQKPEIIDRAVSKYRLLLLPHLIPEKPRRIGPAAQTVSLDRRPDNRRSGQLAHFGALEPLIGAVQCNQYSPPLELLESR